MWSQNKQLPYVLIAPASLFLAVFFLYPFYLSSHKHLNTHQVTGIH